MSDWIVYILRCSDGTLYTGISNNIKNRLKAHNTGKGAKYTRGRAPVILMYTEAYSDKGRALRRELEIKALSRKQKEELIKSYIVFY